MHKQIWKGNFFLQKVCVTTPIELTSWRYLAFSLTQVIIVSHPIGGSPTS